MMKIKKNNPVIYLICGRARTGKNTVADIIYDHYKDDSVRLSYTTYLKNYAMMISNWNGEDETKPRSLLQSLGTEIIKDNIDSKLLINRTIEDIKVLSYFKKVIIISGARRKDEIDDLKKIFDNVVSIKVLKNNVSQKLSVNENNHITETDLDDYDNFDYKINNDGSISELEEKVNLIISEVENYE